MLSRSLRPASRSQPAARAAAAAGRGQLQARLAHTPTSPAPPGGSRRAPTAVPYVALGGVLAVGAYYVTRPETPRPLNAIGEEELEERQVRHFLLRKKQHDEIEHRHAAELKKELDKLVAEHGEDILEQRRACELRRQRVKEHEQLLMKHRHDESFPNMRGKTQSWAEQQRAQAVKLTHDEQPMLALKEKLEREKGCKFDDCL